jgi:hypothetical protein
MRLILFIFDNIRLNLKNIVILVTGVLKLVYFKEFYI